MSVFGKCAAGGQLAKRRTRSNSCKRGRGMANWSDQLDPFRSILKQFIHSDAAVPRSTRACFTRATRARRASLGVLTLSAKSTRAALPQCSRSKPSGSMPHIRQSPGGRLAITVAYNAKASAWSVFIWLTMSVSANVNSGAATLAMRSAGKRSTILPNSTDVVAARDLERVRGKIGKVGISPCQLMAREKPRLRR